ncbi:hypothetical protein [Candidatus Binatus sp.]|uniref:hypothetical protein n=2 Tax=Candidatus Binatus sp. TaxID=2811406 RepID=UPI003BDF2828
MPIIAQLVPIYQEILALPDVVGGPVLSWGVTKINIPDFFRKPWAELSIRGKRIKLYHWLLHNLPWKLPEGFDYPDLGALLRARGVQTIDILDWYDSRATLRLDMNQPVAAEFHNRYRLFIDIGCLEHVFDTRQCIESCLRMVAPGGHYVLCTPVSGWVGHGFHTFDPKGLELALTLNGFEIVYHRYTTRGEGRIVERPKGDTLIWLVGRKLRPMNEFKIPQQDYWWGEVFGTGPRPSLDADVGKLSAADESQPARARAAR